MKTLGSLLIALTSAALPGQARDCSLENATLSGVYALTMTGTGGSPVWAPFTGPVATVGKIVFDGQGNLQMPTVTVVAANPPLNTTPPVTVSGSYAIKSDCTGSMTLNFSPNPNGHYNLVVSPNGKLVTMIATDKGDVLTGTAVRLSH
jgi:hypothetical protein